MATVASPSSSILYTEAISLPIFCAAWTICRASFYANWFGAYNRTCIDDLLVNGAQIENMSSGPIVQEESVRKSRFSEPRIVSIPKGLDAGTTAPYWHVGSASMRTSSAGGATNINL